MSPVRTHAHEALRAPTAARGWVPIVLAVSAVGCQIVYPLVEGSARDACTVLTVVLFSAASLSHALIQRGLRTALIVAGVFVGGGLVVEVIGVATGFPFGTYTYSDRLGPMLGEVPVVISLAWAMLGYPALVLARHVTRRPWLGISIGAGALAAWDLFLDPQMVAEGYWQWFGEGPNLIGSIPVTNFLAWYATSWLMMASLWHLAADWSPTAHDDRVPVALYVWTWVGSVVAHVAFFGLPQSALYGGIGMGWFVALLSVMRIRASTAVPTTTADRVHHDTAPEGAGL